MRQDSVTTNLLQFSDTKKKERDRRRRESNAMPAILFLSCAATAFVAMTTQADELIAVAFECCSLKEPVTQNRKPTEHIDKDRKHCDPFTQDYSAERYILYNTTQCEIYGFQLNYNSVLNFKSL